MPEIECPSCGGYGNVPKEKMKDRFVCRKCHAVFHVTPAGRSVLGEPPKDLHTRHGHEAGKGAGVEGAWSLGSRKIQLGVGGGVLLLLLVFFVLPYVGAGSSMEEAGRRLAKMMAADNQLEVRNMSSEESSSDTTLWFSLLRPVLSEMKSTSPDRTVEYAVSARSYGRLAIFFGSEPTTERSAAIAKAAKATGVAPARTSLEVPTYWERDSFGSWRLDGRRTLAVIPIGQ